MADESFTRLSAMPCPIEPTEEVRRALEALGIDGGELWRGEAVRGEVEETAAGPRLQLREHFARDGIEYYRPLMGALLAAGAAVYAYCDPGVEYPGQVEYSLPDGEIRRLSWEDGRPLLDEDTLRGLACGGGDGRRLSEIPDEAVGAAAKRAFAMFADAP